MSYEHSSDGYYKKKKVNKIYGIIYDSCHTKNGEYKGQFALNLKNGKIYKWACGKWDNTYETCYPLYFFDECDKEWWFIKNKCAKPEKYNCETESYVEKCDKKCDKEYDKDSDKGCGCDKKCKPKAKCCNPKKKNKCCKGNNYSGGCCGQQYFGGNFNGNGYNGGNFNYDDCCCDVHDLIPAETIQCTDSIVLFNSFPSQIALSTTTGSLIGPSLPPGNVVTSTTFVTTSIASSLVSPSFHFVAPISGIIKSFSALIKPFLQCYDFCGSPLIFEVALLRNNALIPPTFIETIYKIQINLGCYEECLQTRFGSLSVTAGELFIIRVRLIGTISVPFAISVGGSIVFSPSLLTTTPFAPIM